MVLAFQVAVLALQNWMALKRFGLATTVSAPEKLRTVKSATNSPQALLAHLNAISLSALRLREFRMPQRQQA
jgi:hypothetical protein